MRANSCRLDASVFVDSQIRPPPPPTAFGFGSLSFAQFQGAVVSIEFTQCSGACNPVSNVDASNGAIPT